MRSEIFALLASVALLGPSGASAAVGERPNFLLILADDLTSRDLGFTGNPDAITPNLDRLATESMLLRGMHVASPTCSPARHELYTGLFPVRSGAYPNHTQVYPGVSSIFSYLREAGYRVLLQGKTHIGPPESFPFEYIEDPDDHQGLGAFMRRDSQQPWLATLASRDPHVPWVRGPIERFDPKGLTVPSYLHDNQTTREELARYYAAITALDQQVGAALQELEASGQAERTLVLFLSEQGSSLPYGGKWLLYQNGIHVAALARWPGRIAAGSVNQGLMQYADVAPTLLDAAGIDPASIDTGAPDAFGHRGFDGRSFLAILGGRRTEHRDAIYAQHTTVGVIRARAPYPSRAIFDGRYKLVRNLAPENTFWIGAMHDREPYLSWVRDAANDPTLAARVDWLSRRPAEELYDLATDPEERVNRADDPALQEIKSRLGAGLDRWMRQQGDEGLATEMAAPSREFRPQWNPAVTDR
jgi:N-sulfoglucosamine sulfohydrolase